MKLAFLNYALKTEKKITINTRWWQYLDCAKASRVLPVFAFAPSMQNLKTVLKKKKKKVSNILT